MNKATVTIIIATFNSASTLESTLQSITKQIYSAKFVEILIIDGGSRDATISIAKKYKATVIHNPRTEPVYAKYLGVVNAKGKYILFLDHDECLNNPNSINSRVHIFQSKSNVKAIISTGYDDPPKSSIVNSYINEFGDPFSFFIYKLSKKTGFFIESLRGVFTIKDETNTYIIFNYLSKQKPIIMELCAAGGMINMDWLTKKYKSGITPEDLPHLFYSIVNDGLDVAITKADSITHNSSEKIAKYLNKIKWRIKNNIFHRSTLGQSGYSGREVYQSKYFKLKKFFFLPYAIFILPALFDSILLSITRRNIKYHIHFLLCFYTSFMIIYYYVIKLSGGQLTLHSYDETTKVNME